LKNKFAIFALAALILASLACNSTEPQTVPTQTVPHQTTPTLTDPQAQETRTSTIDTQQEAFLTPETWLASPQTCSQSMTMLISEESSASSATIVLEEKWVDPQGNTVWVYYLLGSDHGISKQITATYTLIPGKSTKIYDDYQAAFLNYSKLNTSSGLKDIDAGILSLFSLTRIDRAGTVPLGLDKIKTGEDIPDGSSPYFAFSYPGQTITAQFSISTHVHTYKSKEPYEMTFSPSNTTTNRGSSGGPICDSSGNVIAIISSNPGYHPTNYYAVPLPQNISTQIMSAIEASHKILQTNNITKAP